MLKMTYFFNRILLLLADFSWKICDKTFSRI